MATFAAEISSSTTQLDYVLQFFKPSIKLFENSGHSPERAIPTRCGNASSLVDGVTHSITVSFMSSQF